MSKETSVPSSEGPTTKGPCPECHGRGYVAYDCPACAEQPTPQETVAPGISKQSLEICLGALRCVLSPDARMRCPKSEILEAVHELYNTLNPRDEVGEDTVDPPEIEQLFKSLERAFTYNDTSDHGVAVAETLKKLGRDRMNAESMPIIRLELQHMKHSIVHHLGIAGSEMGEAFQEAVDAAVASYPFEREVESIVHNEIGRQIADYFRYGAGGKAIREVVQKALDDAFKLEGRDEGSLEQRAEGEVVTAPDPSEADDETLVTLLVENSGRLARYEQEVHFDMVNACRDELMRRLAEHSQQGDPSDSPRVTRGLVAEAVRRALRVFDEWNDATGVFGHGGYKSECESVVEDAVHIGIQMALHGRVNYDEDGQVVYGDFPKQGGEDGVRQVREESGNDAERDSASSEREGGDGDLAVRGVRRESGGPRSGQADEGHSGAEAVTPDTVTVKRVQEEEIRDFAERVGAQIEVVEREKPFNAAHRYYANLKGAEVKDSAFLRSSFGDGATPDEAIAAYAKTVSHETLVFDAYKDSRREVRCPRLVHTPLNTKKAVPDLQKPSASERENEPPLRDQKNLSEEGPLSDEEVAEIHEHTRSRGMVGRIRQMRLLDTITHLQGEVEELKATLDGDPHQTATPEQRRAWRQSAVRYADKLEGENADLRRERDELAAAYEIAASDGALLDAWEQEDGERRMWRYFAGAVTWTPLMDTGTYLHYSPRAALRAHFPNNLRFDNSNLNTQLQEAQAIVSAAERLHREFVDGADYEAAASAVVDAVRARKEGVT